MAPEIGDKVFLTVSQSFLKTNDPMPMLRPPDLVSFDELGVVIGLKPLDIAVVRFRNGTFLLSLEHLKKQSVSESS